MKTLFMIFGNIVVTDCNDRTHSDNLEKKVINKILVSTSQIVILSVKNKNCCEFRNTRSGLHS